MSKEVVEKNYNLKFLKARYKAVNESMLMPKPTRKQVVKSVNFMSKQLLSDLNV